ncbi:MAG: MBL fold metallo-hydrolase [Planctomycetota bacterium]|jgi:glyoxylase-like metal-dependent hydrolase (beta-lactamase superfamily II)|nr:MBL fold metallo-hydrolase [Planctomycetota bacterium]MDP6761894.1 MBL fold metallo-hydrolase [Planctomycetota bacterium]MDP6990657.1 MBL fold metallo-hydrolase [Planctomycetota bacterium]
MECTVVPVTPFEQNCSVLRCERTGRGAVVDPGGDVERILAACEAHAVEVERILITHGHLDHAGGTAALARRLSVPVEGPHGEDRFWIESLVEQGTTFGLEGAESFEPDRWLDEGDRVSVGELELDVHHTPGHTPGHVVFFEPDSRIALVGDVLFQGSIGRTDFPRGDFDQLISSIRERLLPLGDDVTFIPGHGPSSTLGAERRTNPFLLDPDRYRGMM